MGTQKCISQSIEERNEMKYWVWRDRLVNDYMVPGICSGCGIIFNKRGHASYGTSGAGGFDISDEGWVLGYYNAVLATEWKLLYDAGEPTKKTETELWYALKTIDRLDNDAEDYWKQYWGNADYVNDNPNGFMIRDDVFSNFLNPISNEFGFTDKYGVDAYSKFMHLNSDGGTNGKYIKRSILCPNLDGTYVTIDQMGELNGGAYPSAALCGIHASDDWPGNNLGGPEEYSQDNYVGLMIGLVTIINTFPANYKIHDPTNCSEDIYIKEYTIQILARIIHYMYNSWDLYHNNNDQNNYKFQGTGGLCCLLTNPVTGMCIKGTYWSGYYASYYNMTINGGTVNCECSGGGATGYYLSPMYKAVYKKWVIDQDSNQPNDIPGCWSAPWYDDKPYSPTLYTLTHHDDGFGVGSNQIWCNKVDDYSPEAKSEYVFLDLLNHFLWDNEDLCRGVDYYTDYLNTLYNCESDFNPDVQQNYEGDLLPQMLVHNLLKIYLRHSYSFPQSVDINDAKNYPYISNAGVIGTNNNSSCSNASKPTILTAYHTLISTANINNNNFYGCSWHGWVQYKAGRKIVLNPGFKVSEGAYFNAKIDMQNCCQIKPGEYPWINSCYSCTNLAHIANLIVPDNPCAGSGVTLQADINQPTDCYYSQSGFYKWTITDPSNEIEVIPATNNLFYTFNSSGTYHVSVQYCEGTNCSNQFGPHPIIVHPDTDCGSGWHKKDSNNVVNNNDTLSNTIETKITIYPNPTNGFFTVFCSNGDVKFSVEIINIYGEIIFTENNLISKQKFDLSSKPKGVYTVKVVISNGGNYLNKIIFN